MFCVTSEIYMFKVTFSERSVKMNMANENDTKACIDRTQNWDEARHRSKDSKVSQGGEL